METPQQQQKRLKWETQMVGVMSGLYGFRVQFVQPWHFRIFSKGIKSYLDYYQKSKRACRTYNGTHGNWFIIPDFEWYMERNYNEGYNS